MKLILGNPGALERVCSDPALAAAVTAINTLAASFELPAESVAEAQSRAEALEEPVMAGLDALLAGVMVGMRIDEDLNLATAVAYRTDKMRGAAIPLLPFLRDNNIPLPCRLLMLKVRLLPVGYYGSELTGGAPDATFKSMRDLVNFLLYQTLVSRSPPSGGVTHALLIEAGIFDPADHALGCKARILIAGKAINSQFGDLVRLGPVGDTWLAAGRDKLDALAPHWHAVPTEEAANMGRHVREVASQARLCAATGAVDTWYRDSQLAQTRGYMRLLGSADSGAHPTRRQPYSTLEWG